MRADPFRIYSNVRANQEPAEKPCQCSADDRFLAGVDRPVFSADVVCHTEYYRMGIGGDIVLGKCVDGSTVIDDDGDVFETIDRDESLVLVVLHVQQSPMHDLIREWYVPPNSEGGRISAAGAKGTVSE